MHSRSSQRPGGGGGGGRSSQKSHHDTPAHASGANDTTVSLEKEKTIIREYLDKEKAPVEVQKAWQKVVLQLGAQAQERVGLAANVFATEKWANTIEQIAKDALFTRTILEKQQKEKKEEKLTGLSYADALRKGAMGQTTSTTSPRHIPVPLRHMREIMISPGNEPTEQRYRSGAELVKELHKAGHTEVVAARRLPSGDICISLSSISAKEDTQKKGDIARVFSESAKVKKRMYVVLAHGIRISDIDSSKQKETIAEIKEQNPKISEMEILRVAWPAKAFRKQKTHSTLQIAFARPEHANFLVREGLVWRHQVHDCEPFSGDCIIAQCFNCYGYDHIAKMCKNKQVCGFCGIPRSHETNSCGKKHEPRQHMCVNCNGKHPAWSPKCPKRVVRSELAKRAYENRPLRFEEPRDEVRGLHPSSGSSTPSHSTGTQMSTRDEIVPSSQAFEPSSSDLVVFEESGKMDDVRNLGLSQAGVRRERSVSRGQDEVVKRRRGAPTNAQKLRPGDRSHGADITGILSRSASSALGSASSQAPLDNQTSTYTQLE